MSVVAGSGAADPVDEATTARATVDAHGRVTGWSRGPHLLLGYGPAGVLGRSADRLLAEEPPLRTVRALPGWNGTVALRHRDGRRLAVNLLARRRDPGSEGSGCGEWLLIAPRLP